MPIPRQIQASGQLNDPPMDLKYINFILAVASPLLVSISDIRPTWKESFYFEFSHVNIIFHDLKEMCTNIGFKQRIGLPSSMFSDHPSLQ
jgi:hypothetical protein